MYAVGVSFGFVFLCLFRLCFHDSLGHFILLLLAFVVLGLDFSILSQEIGRKECLRHNLFYVVWDMNCELSF